MDFNERLRSQNHASYWGVEVSKFRLLDPSKLKLNLKPKPCHFLGFAWGVVVLNLRVFYN